MENVFELYHHTYTVTRKKMIGLIREDKIEHPKRDTLLNRLEFLAQNSILKKTGK